MNKSLVIVLLFLLFHTLVPLSSRAQDPAYLEQLKRKARFNNPPAFDTSLNFFLLFNGKQINYLYPLYQAYGKENKFKTIFKPDGYYRNLSQLLGFAGDYKASTEALENSYEKLDDQSLKDINSTIAALNKIEFLNAKEFVLQAASGSQLLLINEAHDKPQHRAFTLSLLQGLYDQGFRYLAMEMLNNYRTHNLKSVDAYTGHYCMEPVGGELARKALQIGFQLVSYEDTAYNKHTVSESDSIQATNINAVLLKDPKAKILVHAGYAHIAKKKADDKYTPMAMWLKKISGLEPLSVDQTNLTEQSTFNYGAQFYEAVIRKFPITKPSVALINRRLINISGSDLYDVAVIHPPTIYKHGRPSWLDFDGTRQETRINPTEKNLYLLQAYYGNEYNEIAVDKLVPADQTYIPGEDGYYSLFLQKGNYILVYRDIDYQVIATKDWEVK